MVISGSSECSHHHLFTHNLEAQRLEEKSRVLSGNVSNNMVYSCALNEKLPKKTKSCCETLIFFFVGFRDSFQFFNV